MIVLYEGPWNVHYGQLYLETKLGQQAEDMSDHFADQANGLVGAAVPGALFLITGLHTGHIALRVELHESCPPIDDLWEDVVEASLHIAPPAQLVEWSAASMHSLNIPEGNYRVRWSARGMDAGHDADTILADESHVDSYLLQLWLGEPLPDVVIRQTSAQAKYWHESLGHQR